MKKQFFLFLILLAATYITSAQLTRKVSIPNLNSLYVSDITYLKPSLAAPQSSLIGYQLNSTSSNDGQFGLLNIDYNGNILFYNHFYRQSRNLYVQRVLPVDHGGRLFILACYGFTNNYVYPPLIMELDPYSGSILSSFEISNLPNYDFIVPLDMVRVGSYTQPKF